MKYIICLSQLWVAVSSLSIIGSLATASALPNFPQRPEEANENSWLALQASVAAVVSANVELLASDGAANDGLGFAVALSSNTALVGATGKKVGSNSYAGTVYVFAFNGTSWVQQQELLPSSSVPSGLFGRSIALSGNTALIGGKQGAKGAVYVFTSNGTTWSQQQELVASDAAFGDLFGYSVALSGTTAVIGAENKTIGSNAAQGAAYVFTFNGTSWVEQQRLTASDGAANDFFGYSIGISGSTALVGAYYKTLGANSGQGAAYVYAYDGTSWVQQQRLTADDGALFDMFGVSVAVSGTTALVGANSKSLGNGNAQGVAYIYTFDGTNWNQQQRLTASDGSGGDSFGTAVTLSAQTAIVGAPGNTIGTTSGQGSAYVYSFDGATWVQTAQLAPNVVASSAFGASVALFGSSALVGARYRTVGANNSQGAAYVINGVVDEVFRDSFGG